jgi:hypothetical protein
MYNLQANSATPIPRVDEQRANPVKGALRPGLTSAAMPAKMQPPRRLPAVFGGGFSYGNLPVIFKLGVIIKMW